MTWQEYFAWPYPKGGDYAREPTPFHHIYRRLFPVIIDLVGRCRLTPG